MEIAHWMTRRPLVVKPRDSVMHARVLMAEHRLNQLPVAIDGGLVGIVTDRDVRDATPSLFQSSRGPRRARRLPAGADPARIEVEAVMTRDVLTLAPGDPIEAAARLMRRERLGSVPVVEGERLVGILTRSDVLDAFLALAEAARGVPGMDVRRRTRVARPDAARRKENAA